MKQISILFLFSLLLTGCGFPQPPLTPQEIVKQNRVCQEAGLKTTYYVGKNNKAIYFIQCE